MDELIPKICIITVAVGTARLAFDLVETDVHPDTGGKSPVAPEGNE